MDNSLLVEGLNIADLSDEELSERLQNLGFIPGPILSTTRSVYERKLARLLRHESFLEEEEAAREVDAEVISSPILHSTFLDSPRSNAPSPPSFCASPPTLNYDDLRRRPLNRDSDVYSGATPHKAWSADDLVSQVEPPPGEMERPLLSPQLKCILILLVALFVFIVYRNMEPAPVNPFSPAP